MLHVQCPGCMESSYIECGCPAGHPDNVGRHHPSCALSNIDMTVGCGCCPDGHDHGAAARGCPGDHEWENCPEEKGECRLWDEVTAEARHPSYRGGHPLLGPEHRPGDDIPPCPGGHCHKDTPGCTVCRPLIITVMPGTEIFLVGRD